MIQKYIDQRDESLFRSIVSYEDITTADGSDDGSTTLICSRLTTKPDFDGGTVVIASGDYKGQSSSINGITTGGTVTPITPFDGQITANTKFKITTVRTAPAEVAAIEAKLDDGTTGLANIKALIDAIKAVADNLPDSGNLTALLADIASILEDTGTTLPGTLATIAGYIDTEVAAIEAKLDDGTTGLAALKTAIADLITRTKGLNDIHDDLGTHETAQATNRAVVNNIHDTDLPAVKTDTGAIKTQTDKLAGDTQQGTASAGTAAETDIFEMTITARRKIHSVWLDLTNLTTDATIKLYYKIDSTNYREFESLSWTQATDPVGVYFDKALVMEHDFKVRITGGEGAGVNIPYECHYENM